LGREVHALGETLASSSRAVSVPTTPSYSSSPLPFREARTLEVIAAQRRSPHGSWGTEASGNRSNGEGQAAESEGSADRVTADCSEDVLMMRRAGRRAVRARAGGRLLA